MANTTIYPFGTGGELPSNIGIINDIVTGGVDKALSAEQGKVLGGMVTFGTEDIEAVYGYDYELANIPNDSYEYATVADSESALPGRVKKIKANFTNTGTAKFVVGRYDETHQYLDVYSEFDVTIETTGNQELTVDEYIPGGFSLFVKPADGVPMMFAVVTGDKPSGWKVCIIKNDGAWTRTTNVALNMTWTIEQEQLSGTVKEHIIRQDGKIEDLTQKLAEANAEIDSIKERPVVVSDGSNQKYEVKVVNGQLVAELITYHNILVITHSFGAIISNDDSSVWERGMSSSSMTTDYIAQFNSVFNGTLQRFRSMDWENAWPDPSSQLSALDSYLSASIDLIVIMTGANVPLAYHTRAYAKTNFSALVNYCKAVATDAKVVLCSSGYTDDSNVFNLGIKDAADDTASVYCPTYSTDAEKYANYGDIVYDHTTGQFNLVINSSGRVTHPNDIWHLSMANAILNILGYDSLNKINAITVNNQSGNSIHSYTKWVAGGRCTVVTYGNSAPTVVVKDSSDNTVSGVLVNLAGTTWDTTPPVTPKFAYHFEMPDSDVTITIS